MTGLSRSSFLCVDALDDQVALFDGLGRKVTYGALKSLANQFIDAYDAGLLIIKIANRLDVVTAYAALLQARVPCLLIDEEVDQAYFDTLVASYEPSYLFVPDSSVAGYTSQGISSGDWMLLKRDSEGAPVHSDLALMLSTSGSTGSPKFVRLSHDAIRANSYDIAEGLNLTNNERAVTCLPCSYTYGLSIVNSHLAVGASILVTNEAVVSSEFWNLVRDHEITSLAGVPTTYKMLKQMRWSPKDTPSLRYVTQAGGRLHDSDRQYFVDLLDEFSIDFVVMYGQTEATARITICPVEVLRTNISTAGMPIPNGSISIADPDSHGVGHVIYSGVNVMMGYAESKEDLLLADEYKGVLDTGDLGYIFNDALFLTGRSKRIVKIFGTRVSLDDVDGWISSYGQGVAVQGNDCVEIFMETSTLPSTELKTLLAGRLKLHSSGIRITQIDALPLLPSGKLDMQALTRLVKK